MHAVMNVEQLELKRDSDWKIQFSDPVWPPQNQYSFTNLANRVDGISTTEAEKIRESPAQKQTGNTCPRQQLPGHVDVSRRIDGHNISWKSLERHSGPMKPRRHRNRLTAETRRPTAQLG